LSLPLGRLHAHGIDCDGPPSDIAHPPDFSHDAAAMPGEMNIPGFDFHPLRGLKPTRYSVHVNGPWCITFEFDDGDACRIDLEQYH
jgi:RelE-like toxin of type II toxin-antitoxin system HigB